MKHSIFQSMNFKYYILPIILSIGQSTKAQIEPTLFAENVISTGAMDFNASFSEDGQQVYFSVANISWSTIAICTSNFKDGTWQKPSLLPFSGAYLDADPFMFNNERLYFISDRPINGTTPYTKWDYNIWYSEKKEGDWSPPVYLEGPFNKLGPILYPSLSDNKNLYFTSNNQLYRSTWENGAYQEPQKLDFVKEDQVYVDSVVSKNEDFIIFSAPKEGSPRDMDIWISLHKNGVWQEPANMGKGINSLRNEGQPGLSADQKTLFYSYGGAQQQEKLTSYDQLLSKLLGPKNGLLDIYQVSIPKEFFTED